MGNLPGTLSSVQPRGHKAGARSLTNKARWIIAITINCSRGLRAQSSRAWQRQENFHASWLPFEGPSLHHSPRIHIHIPPRDQPHTLTIIADHTWTWTRIWTRTRTWTLIRMRMRIRSSSPSPSL